MADYEVASESLTVINLWLHWDELRIDSGTLYKGKSTTIPGEVQVQAIVPKTLQGKILKATGNRPNI